MVSGKWQSRQRGNKAQGFHIPEIGLSCKTRLSLWTRGLPFLGKQKTADPFFPILVTHMQFFNQCKVQFLSQRQEYNKVE